MSTIDEQDLIRRLTLRGRTIVALYTAGVVLMLGVSIATDMQRAGGGRRHGPGAVPGKAAGANAARQPGKPPASTGDRLTWLLVGIPAAVFLPLSIFVPRWFVTRDRRKIAMGTWTSPSRRDGSDTLFGPAALRSETGKLAFVYMTQLIIGAGLNQLPPFFAAIAYVMTKDPIALGAFGLFTCGIAARFPTRAGVANWIDGQQVALIEQRQAAGLPLPSPGAGILADSRSDARTPTGFPAESPLWSLSDTSAPRAWNAARKEIAFTVFWNAFTGFWVYVKLYGEDPKLAGWGGWLFLSPFILIGVLLLALSVTSVIRAIKIARVEELSRSRRIRRSQGS